LSEAFDPVLNTETLATAAAIAAVLIDNAIPTASAPPGASSTTFERSFGVGRDAATMSE
jgi:hypothetical protein